MHKKIVCNWFFIQVQKQISRRMWLSLMESIEKLEIHEALYEDFTEDSL